MTANGERPSGIPSDAYPPFVRLMKSCWDRQPHLRPSFAAIIEMLNGMDENIRTGPALLAASPPRPPPQLRQQPMQMQMQQMQGQMQGQQPMQVRHPQAVHVAHQQQHMAPQPPYFNQYQDL
jgi:mitogen-activated protein kinase kinase kinase MLK4